MVRAETPDDHNVIHEINAAAFGREDEARLIAALRNLPGFDPGLSLVAESYGWPVGHIIFFPVDVVPEDGQAKKVLALCPMAVLPEYQRRGVGGIMVREGLKIAADKGHRGVIVQCNGDYYPRFGFLPAEIFGIRYPVKIPPGAFLAIELGEGSLAGYNGTVNYPEVYGI